MWQHLLAITHELQPADVSPNSAFRELLKRGGTVDPREFTRNVTPFWYSALVGSLSSGEMLIDARCDVDACDSVNRHTPLMLCAIGNFLKFAEREQIRLYFLQTCPKRRWTYDKVMKKKWNLNLT